MIQGEKTDGSVNCCGANFVDAEISQDVSIYKDIIRRLRVELEKIKSENEKLRETVVVYSLKLPQVSRKLNTLVACLEAKVHKLNRRKKRRSNDEVGDSYSSLINNLSEEEDRGCCELRDEGSEEDVSLTVQAPANTRRHQAVQNFVEVICEEENSVGGAIIPGGCLKNEALRDQNPKGDRNRDDDTVENKVKYQERTRTAIPLGQKSGAQEKMNTSKAKHSVLKRGAKRKKQLLLDKSQHPSQVEESSGTSKLSKSLPKSLEVDDGVGKVVSKMKREESLESGAVVESAVVDSSVGPKFGMNLHETIIDMGSSHGAVSASDSGISNNNSNLFRRGRRRVYGCEVCGRTFARSSNLVHHVMRHKNERPHQCEICDRAFVQKSNLKVHLRSHTGERPFSCPECGRAFAQKNNALRHLRGHVRKRQLQEQKLVCPVCSKSFGRWPSYETHMRRVHGNSESNPLLQMAPCMVEEVVNESPPSGDPSHIGEVNASHLHPLDCVHLHAGSAMASSPVGPPRLEHLHPPNVSLMNVHPGDAINNGPLPVSHHPPTDHLVGLNAGQRCGNLAC